MDLEEIVNKSKLFPVVRASSQKEATKIIDAILRGGIKVIELTMSVPGAIDLMKELTGKYKDDDIIIGAGTILDDITARLAILNGAKFIISPILDPNIIRLCNKYSIAVIPGAATPTEIVRAKKLGASAIKVFPCDTLGGPKYIKNILGPLPYLKLIPTGGVNLNTAKEFLDAGAYALGVGSALIDKKAIAEGNYNRITELAKKYLEIIERWKNA